MKRIMRKGKQEIAKIKEHQQQIKELEEARTALLNILEDAEESNKKLLETQNELKKTIEELKKLDKQKDEFISIAAHELKTPLTSLIGFATLLEDGKNISDKERLMKYLRVIKDDSIRLTNLVTDILDLSRIDLGNLKLYPVKISLCSLLEKIKESFEPKIKQKKIFIKIDCPKKTFLVTDKERLVQVLNNLITNAVNYTENGGITIKVRSSNEVMITVSDTGIGISEEGILKLFKRFSQVDSTLTREVGGSGLGLAICKGIIEAMGGKISVTSKVDVGSEFTIRMPIAIDTKKTRHLSLIKK